MGECSCTREGALAGKGLSKGEATKQVEMYSSSRMAHQMPFSVITICELCNLDQRLVGGVGEAEDPGRVNGRQGVLTEDVKAEWMKY